MLQDIQRKVIRFALDLDIDSVNTYAGYKGDLIVKLLTKNRAHVIEVRKYALSIDVKEVVIKEKLDTAQFELYCVTADDGMYQLR